MPGSVMGCWRRDGFAMSLSGRLSKRIGILSLVGNAKLYLYVDLKRIAFFPNVVCESRESLLVYEL